MTRLLLAFCLVALPPVQAEAQEGFPSAQEDGFPSPGIIQTPERYSISTSCPWQEGITSVYVDMTSVGIDGKFYRVASPRKRRWFTETLRACGLSESARTFSKWRSYRLIVNWSAGLGIFVFWPELIVTPVAALMAGGARSSFERTLLMEAGRK